MLSGRGKDKEDTVVWYVTPFILVDGQKRFEGRFDSLLCNNQIVLCHTPDGFTFKVQDV